MINAFHVISAKRSDVFVVPGDEMNDPKFKEALAKKIRAHIAETNAQACVLVSDAFVARVNPADKVAMAKERLRQNLGMNLEQGARAGLCEIREVVLISCETPQGACCMVQEYLRDPSNPLSVMIIGEPEITNDGPGTGRFFGMFPSRNTQTATRG